VKNFKYSDYALNKHSEGIIYRFADGIVEVTLADFLAENPSRTAEDFERLKAASDALYLKEDRATNAQTKRNVSLTDSDAVELCTALSPETLVIYEPEEARAMEEKLALANLALSKLTKVQRRRFLLNRVHGLTTREIADAEGVAHQSVVESIMSAEKKIKKFLANA
jgi:hypothetical protein